MRNSLAVLVLSLGAIAGAAALLSAQQSRPGMSEARVWINNRGREEAIPVTIANVHPDAPPVPVAVNGFALVDFTDRARATLTSIKDRPQTVVVQPRQWEYRELKFDAGDDRVTPLNQSGAQGWELTGFTVEPNGRATAMLKRPR